MGGWHNAVATRLGEALAETEGREPRDGKASQYFDSSLSVTPFHGAQNYSYPLAGASGFGKPTPRRGAHYCSLAPAYHLSPPSGGF